jgi:ferredoxin
MQENLIYCFTGTGNSLQAAREIKELTGDTEILPILPHKETYSPVKYKRIGFVFPVYFWGLPLQVNEFLESLDISNNKDTYYFTIVTCGAVAGNAFAMINQKLTGKGAYLHYARKIKMPDNYIPIYTAKDLTEDDKNKYNAIIKEAAKEILENKKIKTGKGTLLAKVIHNKARSSFPNGDKNFIVENCTGCGICAAVCPAKNITLNDKTPVFHHTCQQCMACIQYCPSNAINYRKKTIGRKRYQNPQVSLKDRKEFYADNK